MKKDCKDLIIYYEDKSIIIVYKDGGLLTINNDKNEKNLYSTVFKYLHKKNQKIFVVHRLDKDTSGIVIFAKNLKIKEYLQNNWDKVSREYIAVVHGNIKDEGCIESYLKETKSLFTYSTNDKKNGKYSKTIYKKICYNNKCSLVKLILSTGRKNQLRVHMSDNKTPILGDKKYGIKDGYRKMMLLANKVDFIHPITKKRIIIDIGIPQYFKKVVDYNE